ncbi:ECF transporter S component [Clostridium paraputrificum]|uniref:ECF transporter S component n=1 Tax=Clostridium paraputrificum TaxID=29363 RepID=UPI003D33E30D
MKKNLTQKLTLMGICVALNILGAFIALILRIPILLDSIGTIMVAAFLGPTYAVTTGLVSSIISGVTYDIYSLYFAPVQIIVGVIAGILYKKDILKGKKIFISVILLSVFSALAGAIIAAFVFDGVTSSASSYIVQMLSAIGISKVVSIFIIQFLMDYADRLISVVIVNSVIGKLPKVIIERLRG